MKRLLLVIPLFLICCGAYGQGTSSYTPQLLSYSGAGNPPGVCAIYQQAVNITNGNYFNCNMNGNANIGSWVATGSSITTTTVSGLAVAPAANTLAIVTDGPSCTVGGGSTRTLCQFATGIWNVVGGSSFTSVSVLPATCAPGVVYALSVNPTQLFIGNSASVCIPETVNVNTLVPEFYGGNGDVQAIFDASYSNTLTSITSAGQAAWCNGGSVPCANGKTSDVGKLIFATNCGPVSQQILSVLQTTKAVVTIATVVSATSITITGGTATATIAGTGCVTWGTNNTTAMSALQTAQVAASNCQSVYLPGRYMVIIPSGGYFNTESSNCTGGSGSSAISAVDYSEHIYGNGPGVSWIVPYPSSNLANCTGGQDSDACFFGGLSATVRDISVWGGGFGNTGAVGVQEAMAANVGDNWFNVTCAGWGGNDANFTGLGAKSSRFSMFTEDGCGSTGVISEAGAGNLNIFLWSFMGDNSTTNLLHNQSLTDCVGCQFGIITAGSMVKVVAGVYRSSVSQAFLAGSGVTDCVEVTGGVAYFSEDDYSLCNTQAGQFALWLHNAGIAYSSMTKFAGGATNGAILRQNTATFNDLNGNTFGANLSTTINPTCAESAGNGTCAAVTGSTNEKGVIRITAGTTTTTNPSFTMTFAGALSGASAQAPSCTFQLAQTGTGSWVTAAPAAVGLPMNTAVSTASVTVGITTTVNTVSASTYDVTYSCVPK